MWSRTINNVLFRFLVYERGEKTLQFFDTHMATVMCYMFFCPFLAFDFMVGL